MLKKESIQRLATLAKIKIEDLEKALTEKDEVDLTIPEKLNTYTEEEITTLKGNEYKAGKTAGVEIAVKEAKEEMGLDFTGKTMKGLVEAAQKKAIDDAKINPDQRVKDMEAKLANLQNTAKEYETKLAEKDKEVSGLKDSYEIGRFIPAPKEGGISYTQDEILAVMKMNGYDFKREETGMVAYKAGQKQLDKLSNPVPVGDVIKGFMKERKYIGEDEPTPGGRGAGDRKPGAKATKLSELTEEFKAAGKSTLGQEFNERVQAAVKDNPEFDMAS